MTGKPKKYRISDQERVGGRGLFAAAKIRKNEKIYEFEPTVHRRATRTSVQVGKSQHMEGEDDANDFLNHACEPTVWIDTEAMCSRALRDLEPGEELTFNYLTTEAVLHSPFQCGCGAERCFGWIAGFRKLARELQESLRDRLAPHLLAELDRTPAARRRPAPSRPRATAPTVGDAG